ncbi:MAG: hypothetical protein IT198_16630 [Acidimicrobiia bacterium]|nr:hypothetical protein [Acidimicrobiia bacterium]
MITDALLDLIFGLLDLLLGLFPSWIEPSWASDGSITCSEHYACLAGEWLARADGWIDVDMLVTVLGVLGGAVVVGAALRGAIWVYGLIPGKAS